MSYHCYITRRKVAKILYTRHVNAEMAKTVEDERTNKRQTGQLNRTKGKRAAEILYKIHVHVQHNNNNNNKNVIVI